MLEACALGLSKAEVGRRGEDYVVRRLVAAGWSIRHRNWRCPHGELDVVASLGSLLAIVEVRTRRGSRLGTPEESVGYRKRAKLAVLATAYLAEHPWPGRWRIDVAGIEMNTQGDVIRARYVPNAVTGL
jgi:putative endonuclease